MKRSMIMTLCLSAAFCFSDLSWSTSTLTGIQEVDAIDHIAPVYQHPATDPFRIVDIEPSGGTDLNGASFGTFATSAPSLFYLDGSNNLWITATLATNAFRHYKAASVASSWSATTTLVMTEDDRDGVSGPGSAHTFNLILTKTGSVADLTLASLYATLKASTTTVIPAALTGTALASATAMPSGWTVKGFGADSSAAAEAVTIDPIVATLSVPVTPLGSSTPISFSTTVNFLEGFNTTTSATTTQTLLLQAPTSTTIGKSIQMSVLPAKLARTSGIAPSLVTSLNAMPSKRIHQTTTNVAIKNTLPLALSQVLGMMSATPPTSVLAGITTVATSAVGGASFLAGDFTTTADTNKLALINPNSADLTSVTWKADGTVIKVTATLGTNAPEVYSCDLSGIETISDSAATVQTFTAPSGLSFLLKCLDSTGYDTSSDSTVDATERDALLALQIKGKLAAITTIAHLTLNPTVVASLS